MAQSRTNNKSKKSKVPMWAVAAIVVVVVAVAGYAIIRFSQASTNKVQRRAAKLDNQSIRGNSDERFRCRNNGGLIGQKSDGGGVFCQIGNGQHASGFWYNEGSYAVDFNTGGFLGANGNGKLCANVSVPANASVRITAQGVGGKGEFAEDKNTPVYKNTAATRTQKDICTIVNLSNNYVNKTNEPDYIVGRLYNVSTGNDKLVYVYEFYWQNI